MLQRGLIGAPAAVELKADRTTIAADGSDLAYIEANIVDSHGVLVPQDSSEISFSVTGPGHIVGVDNGNAISHESYKGSARAAFNGKALVIVQATTTPGTVTIQATSGALTAASVSFATSAP